MFSLVIPVYNNENSLPDLLDAVDWINNQLAQRLDTVFVVDGSPDRSLQILSNTLPQRKFKSKIISLSRNFGAFSAIRKGLETAEGPFFAVMAADLQEPPQLIVDFFIELESSETDVILGSRRSRKDPPSSRIASSIFWKIYRATVQPDIPAGGVDIFACNKKFRDHLLSLKEVNSSLIAQIFWLGFDRKTIPYDRMERCHGKSAWTFKKKLKYLNDSIFSFSDLPIKMLFYLGLLGMTSSTALSLIVFTLKLSGKIIVPGYTATILTVSFFAGLNFLGLGIIGAYVWRAFENTKSRPDSIVAESVTTNSGIGK